MSDLFEDPAPGQNAPEYSVTELSGAIKRVIESEFGHVRIRGEIGRVSMPRSGHVYLDLKDDRCVISGVIWKGVAARLTTRPEEGMEVVATGRLTTFGGQSKYQVVIEDIRPAGVGALMAMLEKRKAALAAEGLFDAARKRALPYLPEIIGVVTSPSGAVIRDILHRLQDRFPRKVLVWPVAVQGANCAPEVARAIAGFNALSPGGALPRPDLLIVARGGGSIEDLWGFNEEIVARAAAASEIPLISAVGHETDTTLIDHVSDRRAPTPTAAAELAVPVRLELMATCESHGARLVRALGGGVAQRGQRLRDLARALPRLDTLLDGPSQRLDRAAERLPVALMRGVEQRRLRLADMAGVLRPSRLREAVEQRRQRLTQADRLNPALQRAVDRRAEALAERSKRLTPEPLSRKIARERVEFERLSRLLGEVGQRQTGDWRRRIDALERMRQGMGYVQTLQRGYAVVRAEGEVVTRRAEAEGRREIEIEFADGRLRLEGEGSGSGGGTTGDGGASRRAARAPKTPPEQGSLL